MKNDNMGLKRAPNLTTSTLRRVTIAAAVVAGTLFGSIHVDAADPGTEKQEESTSQRPAAQFEGKTLDLTKDWGDASACWVDEVGAATCFRSEAEMDRALVAAGKDLASTNPASQAEKREGARAAGCSSSLRVYRDNYYGGSVVYLSQRGYWINLSWYGFDNVASSYRVGGCNTTFKSGSGGGGTTYWGATSAWASRSSMSGWNNVLSSVYIS